MTSHVLPGSPAYRRLALALGAALERQHERLDHNDSDNDEPQKQKSRRAVTQRQGKQMAERPSSPRL